MKIKNKDKKHLELYLLVTCNMRLTDQGKYSTTAQRYSKQICKKIQDYYPGSISKAVVTDACAGNGGDTLTFSKYFNYINAIEKDPHEFNYLRDNLEFMKIQNVSIFNKSYLKTNLTQDIIYFDPPWGGPEYKKKKSIDLFLDKINIIDIVERIILRSITKIIAIKVPHNFNSEKFKLRIPNMKKFVMTKFSLIVIPCEL